MNTGELLLDASQESIIRERHKRLGISRYLGVSIILGICFLIIFIDLSEPMRLKEELELDILSTIFFAIIFFIAILNIHSTLGMDYLRVFENGIIFPLKSFLMKEYFIPFEDINYIAIYPNNWVVLYLKNSNKKNKRVLINSEEIPEINEFRNIVSQYVEVRIE